MKLFRKIRQSFIKDGNLKKYLLYALGEILLVMIGILLAFQVNNWNDDRIRKLAEVNFYQNLKDQLANDAALIRGVSDYNDRHYTQFEYANKIIETNDRDKMDTLGLIAIKLTNYSDFDRQGNIYETMVNSGEIQLLHNHEIINGVRELEEKYMYINRMENIHYDAMIAYAAPALSGTIKLSTKKILKPDTIYSFEFQNLVLSLMDVMREKEQVYTEAIGEIDRVTELIDKELGI